MLILILLFMVLNFWCVFVAVPVQESIGIGPFAGEWMEFISNSNEVIGSIDYLKLNIPPKAFNSVELSCLVWFCVLS